MTNVFAVLFLLTIIGIVLAMIRPKLVMPWSEAPNRKKAVGLWTGISVACFVAFGVSTDREKSAARTGQPTTENAQQAQSANDLPNSGIAEKKSSIPKFDIDVYCKQIAIAGGGSQMILQGCYQQEQMNYDRIRSIWDALPTQMRIYCEGIGRAGGGSYMILGGCIDQEKASAGANKGFEFKR